MVDFEVFRPVEAIYCTIGSEIWHGEVDLIDSSTPSHGVWAPGLNFVKFGNINAPHERIHCTILTKFGRIPSKVPKLWDLTSRDMRFPESFSPPSSETVRQIK